MCMLVDVQSFDLPMFSWCFMFEVRGWGKYLADPLCGGAKGIYIRIAHRQRRGKAQAGRLGIERVGQGHVIDDGASTGMRRA